jgi:hypothetical protein
MKNKCQESNNLCICTMSIYVLKLHLDFVYVCVSFMWELCKCFRCACHLSVCLCAECTCVICVCVDRMNLGQLPSHQHHSSSNIKQALP